MLIVIKLRESVVADEDYRLSIRLFASYLGDFCCWSFSVITISLSLFLIFEHLSSYKNPEEQKFLIGVVLMVPCYSVESVSLFVLVVFCRVGDNYGSLGIGNPGGHHNWGDSYGTYKSQGFNIWQPGTAANSGALSSFDANKQSDTSFGLNMPVNNNFVSLVHPSVSVDCSILHDCYESFAMYCFGRYLVACSGTDSNPFALDALAVFMFRVLQRVNHPGNLDKSSPNVGYVMLMFLNYFVSKQGTGCC